MRVERVHQPWHPADAAFEETELQSRKAVENPAENQTSSADHISQRKPERGRKMLIALKTLGADEPRVAMLQLKNASGGMKQNGNIQIGDFFVERHEHFVIEIAIAPAAVKLYRLEAQLFDRAPQFFNRFVDIRQIDPRHTDETIVALDIFRDSVVVRTRQLPAELGVDFINQLPIIRNQYLHVE